MKYKLLYELWVTLKKLLKWEKIYPLWRLVLCFFSTDYFIRFRFDWIDNIKNFSSDNIRTIELIYFIVVFILIRFIIYNLLEIPLRLIFHGIVKNKVLDMRKKINEINKIDRMKGTIELLSFVTPFFHKYLFRYGIISSNDLNEPIDFDFVTREKEFNDSMKLLYRWILTIIHTLLVSIIIWKFYAIWFFVAVVIIMLFSILAALLFTLLILNLDYLETIRLRLLKENKKTMEVVMKFSF